MKNRLFSSKMPVKSTKIFKDSPQCGRPLFDNKNWASRVTFLYGDMLHKLPATCILCSRSGINLFLSFRCIVWFLLILLAAFCLQHFPFEYIWYGDIKLRLKSFVYIILSFYSSLNRIILSPLTLSHHVHCA